MFDRGLNLTLQAIRRQLTAMPHDLYLIRLIHHQTKRAFPGERLWTAAQLVHPATVRFLRGRNREGCDVYIQPYAEERNPGYILVDLDHTGPAIVETMQSNRHDPCVVLQTSHGNLQAWVQVSTTPIEPAVATWIGKHLAHVYGGDPASTDWRHLGRLAGFTNQKPQRRNWRGHSPWVKVLHARAGLAAQGAALLEAAAHHLGSPSNLAQFPLPPLPAATHTNAAVTTATAATARIYASWLHRLRILERFPQPDWSIADKWIAKELLQRGTPAPQVATILRGGSPGFPRQHSHPDDYLRRTLACAARELEASPFPGRDLFLHNYGQTHAPGS
ncbi:MAG TPA: DNA-primase RepB domain-containing protein [Candidatus Binatia bacterium]|nr:DNA-primase RepB domain-containing protein [Candidatus Binatia bacterium]